MKSIKSQTKDYLLSAKEAGVLNNRKLFESDAFRSVLVPGTCKRLYGEALIDAVPSRYFEDFHSNHDYVEQGEALKRLWLDARANKEWERTFWRG